MTEEILTRIVTRALSDRTFRDGLATSPQETLADAGYVVTRDQLSSIELARPADWGRLTLEDIIARLDMYQKKR